MVPYYRQNQICHVKAYYVFKFIRSNIKIKSIMGRRHAISLSYRIYKNMMGGLGTICANGLTRPLMMMTIDQDYNLFNDYRTNSLDY